MKYNSKGSDLRQRIALQAAKLLMEGFSTSHRLALRKAAEKLGVANKNQWPTISEIEDTLKQELRLFNHQQPQHLLLMQERALQAAKEFKHFNAHLVGAVAGGTAVLEDPISLYLFAETAEEVIIYLVTRRIPWKEGERMVRYATGERMYRPLFSFIAGNIVIELIVLPPDNIKSPPLSPLTDRPYRGLSIKALTKLLSEPPL